MDTLQKTSTQARKQQTETEPTSDHMEAMTRHQHRERDYGIGYGNSSGYGSERHFTDGHADALFRFG